MYSSSALQITSVDFRVNFGSSLIRIGRADDVIVELLCTDSTMTAVNWSFTNGSFIESGLEPMGISQDNGILRIFPVSLLGSLLPMNPSTPLQCVGASGTLPITLEIGKI